MDLLEKKEYLNNLYDYYKELLTDKQRNYFECYYCFDMSFAEIAEENSISRNAVFDQIKKIVNSLEDYEVKLKLLKKDIKLNEILNKYKDNKNKEIIEIINSIKNLEC